MGPFPGPNSVLILDNCKIHIGANIMNLANQFRVIVLYLPPYLPDFNPINFFFHSSRCGFGASEYSQEGNQMLTRLKSVSVKWQSPLLYALCIVTVAT
jgi:hypothetical protein